MYNIDPSLIKAIAKVESNNKPYAISKDGMDIGLMQVRHIYVKESKTQLLDTCKSIEVGARILNYNKKNCKHKKDSTFVICYNMGVKGGGKIRYPKKHIYYKKVMDQIRKKDTL